MFYVAYFKTGQQGDAAAGDVSVQRRAGLIHRVAAHGSVWAAPGGDGDHRTRRRRPIAGEQRLQPARRERPGVHRRAGNRLQPHRRQGQGEGLLWRRPDAHAFAEFIAQFLSKYGRWNSPKYLFGESYGTTRSAVLANLLETQHDIDLNGVILLSQILNFDLSADGPQYNPGVDLPYELALPTYAATAWYHHKLPECAGGTGAVARRGRAFRHDRLRAGAGGRVQL